MIALLFGITSLVPERDMHANRYETLDGWRGLAALAITFYHVPVAHALRDMAGWKNLEFFVDFFFVLSGFVICHAWGRRIAGVGDAITFMNRRFWRVWPLHIVILGAFLLIECVEWLAVRAIGLSLGDAPFTGPSSVASLLSNIVLMQSLNLHGTTTWNGPAWSISVEFWTYLAFAGVMLFAAGRTWAMVAMAALGALVIAIFSPIWLFATHDFGLARAFYGFFAGAVAYRLISPKASDERSGSVLEIAAVLAMAVWMAGTGKNWTSMLAPIVFVGLVVVFARGGGILSRLLLSKPVQLLGLWSYSIYLVHTLIYYGLRLVLVAAEKKLGWTFTASGAGSERLFSFGGGIANATVIIALLALTIAISALTYRWIEKPFMVGSGAMRPASPENKPAFSAG
jgi:peptidoglycan/LPS O-acetylase OafA/YrhL